MQTGHGAICTFVGAVEVVLVATVVGPFVIARSLLWPGGRLPPSTLPSPLKGFGGGGGRGGGTGGDLTVIVASSNVTAFFGVVVVVVVVTVAAPAGGEMWPALAPADWKYL